MIHKITLIILALYFTQCHSSHDALVNNTDNKETVKINSKFDTVDWQKKLTAEEYYVLREKGTERPYTGKYNLHFEEGYYTCKGCGEKLFSSDSKFNSHCGWPSFDKEIEEGKIVETIDESLGMTRVEITCGNCGGHLGHVFNDGPTDTGLRYCVNSASLGFEKDSLSNSH